MKLVNKIVKIPASYNKLIKDYAKAFKAATGKNITPSEVIVEFMRIGETEFKKQVDYLKKCDGIGTKKNFNGKIQYTSPDTYLDRR